MARRSTRKGQLRKTSRRAYTFPKQKARRVRRRTTYPRVRARSPRRRSTGILKGRSGAALRECAWITGGSAIGMVAPSMLGTKVMGYNTSTVVGAGALAWGMYKNDDKPIYLGFGALYPQIYTYLQKMLVK